MSERFRSGCDLATRQGGNGRAREDELGLPGESIDAFGYGMAIITVEEIRDQKGDLSLWHHPEPTGRQRCLRANRVIRCALGLSGRRRFASEA